MGIYFAPQVYRDEAEFLQKIVEELQQMQSPEELFVTEQPVGLRSRTQKLISTLRLDLKERVLVVAVFGVSGIGKTTIVKETYNKIAATFSFRCFLANIHDLCQVPNWKVVLPNELISCLTRNDKFSVRSSHNDCITMIRRLVSHQKVLLVLDDVDNYQQLEALGINPAWFYQGSRIIVTTRDKQSLGDIPYASYQTLLLNRRECLNLFMRLMFTSNDSENTKFVEEVVSLAGGLPLVLKVWSRHFVTCGKEEWASELEILKRIPHSDVHQQLKKSYDSLNNRAKKLFLDIVCFFSALYDNKNVVLKVLLDEESAFFPNKEIRFLADKSLVEISDLSMPHAIKNMGREIVRQENEDEPGQRTRLWDQKDVVHVLTECSGTESVECIIFSGDMSEEVIFQLEAFRKMCNLRLLCFRYCDVVSWSNCSHDEMTPLPFKKLKYMEWQYFPFKNINNVDMGNVVVLRLRESKLEILWEGKKSLKKLRILDVSFSCNLTKTGDFSGLENLEELFLDHCNNLKELHNSIGCLHKLAILNLSCCPTLKRLPWEMIVKLPSLGLFNLGNTTGLEAKISSNISEFKTLKFLYFHNCPKLGYEDPQFLIKITSLTNLSHLTMTRCSLSQVPSESGNFASLKELDLPENTFSCLPDGLSKLSELIVLVDV